MKRMAILAAALSATGVAQAQMPSPQQIFCAQLNRVVQVAQMDGDFTYLERSRAAPPDFGFRYCRAQAATTRLPPAWRCYQTLAPDALSLASLSERTAACLPNAVRSRGRLYDRQAIFTLPRVRIQIDESGGPGAHVGLIATFRVEAIRPPE